MKLKFLLKDLDYQLKFGSLDLNISGLKYDSREVETGDLFIAVSGFEKDGHNYIEKAAAAGAAAVIIEKEITDYQPGLSYIKVDNSRKMMALIAKKFFGNPLQDINLIGITGTNGKTTTAFLLYNILKKQKAKAALFGTVKNIIGEKEITSKRTTPESIDLYRYFAQMREEGIKFGVMEVSSHALDLYRVAGMDFKAAVFTNLSPEHLDYHQNLENYLEVKAGLFSQLKKDSFAVINYDDQNADFIAQKSNAQNYFYSLKSSAADLKAVEYKLKRQGMEFRTSGLIKADFELNLGGIFNIYNSLAAVLTAFLIDIDLKTIQKTLAELKSVPGRFELIAGGQDFQLVVDYAHTPDGMENVLKTAAEMKKNRLLVLFGCGGDRDRSKRPVMAQIAEKFADYTIVTNDNPRTESEARIFAEIKAGFSESYQKYEIIADRKKSIKKIIEMAAADDLVMLLGRGHEKYQVLKNKKIELDDRKTAFDFLKEKQAKKNC